MKTAYEERTVCGSLEKKRPVSVFPPLPGSSDGRGGYEIQLLCALDIAKRQGGVLVIAHTRTETLKHLNKLEGALPEGYFLFPFLTCFICSGFAEFFSRDRGGAEFSARTWYYHEEAVL